MDAPNISIVVPTLAPDFSVKRLAPMLASGSVREVVVVSQHPEAIDVMPEDGGAGAQIVRLRLVRRGASLARNTGLAAATAPLVVFIDDDVVPHPEYADVICDALGEGDATLLITRTHYGEHWPDATDRSLRVVQRFRDALGSGSAIAVNRLHLARHEICFRDELGGGRTIICGEDSVFTLEIWRRGLKVVRSEFRSVLHPASGSTGWRTDNVYLSSLAYVLRRHFGRYGWYVALRTAARLSIKDRKPQASLRLLYWFLFGRHGQPATPR